MAQVLEVNGSTELLLSWYVYRDGEQIWLLGQAPLEANQAEIPLSAFAGAGGSEKTAVFSAQIKDKSSQLTAYLDRETRLWLPVTEGAE